MAALPETAVDVRTPPPPKREMSREWRAFWRNPLAIAGLFLLGFLVLFCWLGPLVWTLNPQTFDLAHVASPPGAGHPLGTDSVGRDVLARLMLGGQVSLLVGFSSALVGVAVGSLYGLISGHFGGMVDTVMMRIIDITFAIPGIFLLLLLDSIFTPSPLLLVFIIAILSWQGIARIVRSEVLSLRERDFVEAARALGAKSWRIIIRHYLPNTLGPIIVYGTFAIGGGILTIAGLSFLGLGLPPPNPNWGGMLSDGMNYLFVNGWWLVYPPGLLIVFAQLGSNFLGDALNQAFDPRLRQGR